MGDPVTMAVIGGSVGAMVDKKDPLKGAMLGAAGGYGGATLLPMLGTTAAPVAEATTGATVTGTQVANTLPTAAYTGSQVVPALNTAPFAMNPAGTSAIGGINPVTAAGPSTGMIPSSLAETNYMDTALGGLKNVGQYVQDNPQLTKMAAQTAQQQMQRKQAPMAQPGQVSRSAIQPMDYMSLLNPQQGTVLRPQPISLLG